MYTNNVGYHDTTGTNSYMYGAIYRHHTFRTTLQEMKTHMYVSFGYHYLLAPQIE